MNPDEISAEAEALDKFLNGQSAGAGDLPPEEASLAERLLAAAGDDQADAQFTARLESRLLEAAGARRQRPLQATLTNLRRPMMIRKIAIPLAGAAALVVLALFILPLFNHHQAQPFPTPAPQSSLPPTNPAAGITPSAVPTVTQPALPFLPFLDVLTAQAAGQAGGGIFANAQWTLNTTLPEGPAKATVYSQEPGDPLTLESARQMADMLGVKGEIYQSQGEGGPGQKIFTITDGGSRVWFIDSPTSFTYVADYATVLQGSFTPLPFEKQAAMAEAFLKEHGLLDFDYKIEPVLVRTGEVSFARVLDGKQVEENNPFDPRITVQVSDAGQVKMVVYRAMKLQPTGEYPIRSAQAAWDELLSGKLSGQVSYAVTDLKQPARQRSWSRQYPAGQPVDLYGYAEVLQPVDPAIPPLVTLNNLTLSGDAVRGIDQLAPGAFIHVWGELQKEDDGPVHLAVQGWEESPLPEQNLSGKIKLEGSAAFILTSDGKTLKLLQPPDGLEDGLPVNASGVQVSQPATGFDWSNIQAIEGCFTESFSFSGPGGGGGGGGGNCAPEQGASSSVVSGTTGSQPASTPEPVIVPYNAGSPVDDLQGILIVSINEDSAGQRTTGYDLVVGPNAQFPQMTDFSLSGEALQGREADYNLDVRVWGVYSEEGGVPSIKVERLELAYPGQKVQAWLGALQMEKVNGRKVVLFTTRDGTSYVFEYSVEGPEANVTLDYPAGQQILVEGVLEGDKTFGGYPIIRIMSESLEPNRKDLNGYVITSNEIPVITPPTGPGDLIKGQVNVDKVELVYYAADLSHGWPPPPAGDPARSVQPLWAFSGRLEDGRTFEVLVQAVADQYLK